MPEAAVSGSDRVLRAAGGIAEEGRVLSCEGLKKKSAERVRR